MRTKYEIRRDLVKYRNNLKEINRLISAHDNLIRIDKEKIKIKQKIKSLEEKLKEQI